ncbi:zwei Ig domain protein zig-8-like [Cherax quadricarinatus]|uniref:zwei Ig domain protein zig-8-like n=1 Tax=Cherax quadricarinatus TaxID=27406 RepID=UPI00387E3B24
MLLRDSEEKLQSLVDEFGRPVVVSRSDETGEEKCFIEKLAPTFKWPSSTYDNKWRFRRRRSKQMPADRSNTPAIVCVRAGWRRQQRPEFGVAQERVTVIEGQTAKLPCVVHNLHDRSVTWLRRRDLHILTAGHHTYSADQRFQVVHAEDGDEWTLMLKCTQLRDAGVYECQVNTVHKLSRLVTLTVLDPRLRGTRTKVFVANNTASTKDGHLKVEIQGPRELYIEEGSSLTLTCLVTSSGAPSTLVYWYHDTSLVDYNSPRGGVDLQIDRGRGETLTQLVVTSVGRGDSGMYSCVPDGSHPATVLVHVQEGEHEAAIHQGGLNHSSTSTRPSPSLHILHSHLLFLLNLSFGWGLTHPRRPAAYCLLYVVTQTLVTVDWRPLLMRTVSQSSLPLITLVTGFISASSLS